MPISNIDIEMIKKIVRETIKSLDGVCPKEKLEQSVKDKVLKILNTNKNEEGLKKEIIDIGRHQYSLGNLPGTSGNISVRSKDGNILITPSGISKSRLKQESIIKIDAEGKNIGHSKEKPSSETKMHIISYQVRSDIKAIVHVHPPYSTAFAASGTPLDMPVLPEAILVLGKVPLVEYGTPSTWEVPNKLKPYLSSHDVFLLENHGAMAFGKNLKEASNKIETLEFFSKVIFIARTLGGEHKLNCEQINALIKAHGKFRNN